MTERGYERASIAAIAEEADLGFGTFYSHFESKREVFRALVEAAGRERDLRVDEAVAGVQDPAEQLAVRVAVLVELAASDLELTRFLIGARRPADNPGEEVVISDLHACVSAGCTAGRFRVADMDAAVVAVGGVVRGIVGALAGDLLDAGTAPLSATELGLRLLGLDPREAMSIAHAAARRARYL